MTFAVSLEMTGTQPRVLRPGPRSERDFTQAGRRRQLHPRLPGRRRNRVPPGADLAAGSRRDALRIGRERKPPLRPRRGRLRSRTRLPQGAGMRLLRKPRNGTLLHQRSGRLLDRSAAPEPLTQDGSRESLRSGSIRKFEKHYGNGNHGTGRDGGRPDPS